MSGPIPFTDSLLEVIDRTLAAFPPERGGALLAAGGVTCWLVEDQTGAYSGVSWDISTAMTTEVQAAELAGRGAFSGTVHTHPAGVPDPSSQDLRSTARMLDANAHLDELSICVVTPGVPRLGDVAIGSAHRMSVHVARRAPEGTCRVTRVEAHVLPIGRDLTKAGVNPDNLLEVTWHGRRYLGARSDQSDSTSMLMFPTTYPLAGPICLGLRADVAHHRPHLTATGTWDAFAPSGPQLASMVRRDRRRPLGFNDRTRPLVGRLAERKVLIVGLGSVGTTITNQLVRAGVEHLTVIDPELVEGSNLARSTYEADHVGTPKCHAVAELVTRINPAATAQPVRATIADLDTELAALCSDADLVVAATDDPTGQALLSHHAYAGGTPLVSAALYRRADAGEVVISVPEVDTPCWSCTIGGGGGSNRPEKDYATGRLVGEIALGPPIHLVSLVAAGAAIGLLSGPETPAGETIARLLASGRTFGIIATTPEWTFFPGVFEGLSGHQWAPQSVWARVERNPHCPVCGAHRTAPVENLGGRVNGILRRLRSEDVEDEDSARQVSETGPDESLSA